MTTAHLRPQRLTTTLLVTAIASLAAACAADHDDPAFDEFTDEQLAPLDRLMVESADEPGVDQPRPDSLTTTVEPVAQLPGFDLSIAVDGTDVNLSWPSQGDGVRYEVFRSEFPFFAPGGTKSAKLTDDAGGNAFTDVGGGDDDDYFYQVRAHFPAGYFEGSTTVGKKVTKLYKGYTKIGQCLISDVDTSAELFDTIGATAISTHMWDEATQGWTWSWNGSPGDGLVFSTGDVVSVNLGHGHPDRFVATGYVPVIEDVSMQLLPGDNLVTVLPARFGTRMASELLAAVPDSNRIGLWDAATQTTAWYPDGPDFEVPSCSDVHVEVSAPSTWPPPMPKCPCTERMPLWQDLIDGAQMDPVDLCHDEQDINAGEVFVSGADGFVASNRFEGSPWTEYKMVVGTLTSDYVSTYQLDPSLIGKPSCIAYDDRAGTAETRYQLVSADEAASCEDDLRAAVAAQPGSAFCSGGT